MLVVAKAFIVVPLGGEQLLVMAGAKHHTLDNSKHFGPAEHTPKSLLYLVIMLTQPRDNHSATTEVGANVPDDTSDCYCFGRFFHTGDKTMFEDLCESRYVFSYCCASKIFFRKCCMSSICFQRDAEGGLLNLSGR